MTANRKTKAEIAREELARIEKANRLRVQKQTEAKQREWLRVQRSRPRVELPSEYTGESIFVHKKIYDGFMKKKGITITNCRSVGGAGGKLVIEYDVFRGGRGCLELQDLGPMPI